MGRGKPGQEGPEIKVKVVLALYVNYVAGCKEVRMDGTDKTESESKLICTKILKQILL